MTAVWAQRYEELLNDCVISPHVFEHMVDRLCDCIVPYQHCLETQAGQRKVHLDLEELGPGHMRRCWFMRSGHFPTLWESVSPEAYP